MLFDLLLLAAAAALVSLGLAYRNHMRAHPPRVFYAQASLKTVRRRLALYTTASALFVCTAIVGIVFFYPAWIVCLIPAGFTLQSAQYAWQGYRDHRDRHEGERQSG